MFKQLEETRKTAESNLKAIEDSAAEAQKNLQAQVLSLQRQAEKDAYKFSSKFISSGKP